jgi:hypothetical protein
LGLCLVSAIVIIAAPDEPTAQAIADRYHLAAWTWVAGQREARDYRIRCLVRGIPATLFTPARQPRVAWAKRIRERAA